MNHLNKFVGIAITLLIGLFLAQGAVYAHSDKEQKTKARPGRIVGIYDVDVVVEDCTTGATLATFRAMHKYEFGGTGQIVPATSPVALSEHSMIWNHVRGNDYRSAAKMFRFDTAGNNIGWVVIRNDVSISHNSNSYSGYGVAEIFNSDGVMVGASCPSFSGTRFTGEW